MMLPKWIIAFVAIAMCGNTCYAETFSVTDSRPIAAIVQEMITRYEVAITYEDPPYAYAGDIKDVTTAIQRSEPSVRGRKAWVPRESTLSVELPAAGQTSSEVVAATLRRVVDAAAASNRGGKFRIARMGSIFHVIPTEIQGKSGSWLAVAAPLDATISLPSEPRNVDQMLSAICAAISAAAHVKLNLIFPASANIDHKVRRNMEHELSAEGESARSVLARALAMVQPKIEFTWFLLYDPDEMSEGTYYLNIEQIPNEKPTQKYHSPAQLSPDSAISGTAVHQ